MKERAIAPFWSEHRKEWIVGLRYYYEPGEVVTVVRAHASFPTEDEAAAFVARKNEVLQ